MDLSFTPEDTAFQQEVRSWIADAYTPELRAKMAMSKNGYLDKEGQVAWQRKLHERGWVAPNWPQEHGGPGLSPSQRYILNMELSAAGTPTVSPMGLSMDIEGGAAWGAPREVCLDALRPLYGHSPGRGAARWGVRPKWCRDSLRPPQGASMGTWAQVSFFFWGGDFAPNCAIESD